MPEISRFFGIVIYMNFREHPPVHLHAVYGEFEALITLDGKVYSEACHLGYCRWLGNGWLCTATNSRWIGNWHRNANRLTR